MSSSKSSSHFRFELERRLAAEADLMMNSTANKNFAEYSNNSTQISAKKSKHSKLRLRELVATLKLFQPCCFPAVPQSKLTAIVSRRSSLVDKARPASFSATTYKIMTCSGKLSEVKPADNEVIEVFDPVRNEALARLIEKVGLDNWENGGECHRDVTLTLLSYKTQVVVGKNYFVKARVNDGPTCLHCRIYQPVDGEPFLTELRCNKKVTDEIDYF